MKIAVTHENGNIFQHFGHTEEFKVYEVKDGKIIVEGGMWVEADVNIPSGESLIRQFAYGKKFI